MMRRRLSRAIALGLRTQMGIVALAGCVAAPLAKAADECGPGTAVVCTEIGNPYGNGVTYPGGGTITLASGVRVEPTTPQATTTGGGFGVSSVVASITEAVSGVVEAGASVWVDTLGVFGFVSKGAALTLINDGDITISGNAPVVYLEPTAASGVEILSTGTLTTTGAANAIHILSRFSGAAIAIDNSGLIRASGGGSGVYIDGAAASSTTVVQQSGTVDSSGGWGMVLIRTAFDIDNSGTIIGDDAGIALASTAAGGTITNSGVIRSTSTVNTHAGIFADTGDATSIVNTGLIEGFTGIRVLRPGHRISNAGTLHGTGGTAVSFSSNDNTLTLQSGSVLDGDAISTGTNNALILEGTGSEDSNFSGFSTFRMTGDAWEIAGAIETTSTAADATSIESGTLILTGSLDNANGGVTIANGSTLQLGNGGLAGFVSSGGVFDGRIHLQSGVTTGAAGIVNDGVLRFDHAVPGYTFATPISGTGTIEAVSGFTRFTGDSSAFAGNTESASRVAVDGALGGTLNVQSGGLLEGDGHVGITQIADGGVLLGREGQQLTLDALSFDAGATLQTFLGAPASTALFDVLGDVVLDGTLEIYDLGGFGAGVYGLMTYGGTLTDNGMDIGRTPDGVLPGDLLLQTSVANQVNLVSTTGVLLDFWDSTGANNGAIEGGSGTWDAASGNWTGADGTLNGVWDQSFAIFQGTSGTVTIDNGIGAVSTVGMQFASDGYRIDGDALALADPETVVRVGDGTSVGAGFVATIDASLTGDARLVKTDFGTLVLNGLNTYTGGTAILGGTVQVASDANLGDASGGLRLRNSRLSTTADMTSSRAITLEGDGGVFDTASGTTLTLQGVIDGVGDLDKLGDGTLVLTGTNTFAGDTLVFAGTLIGDTDSIRGRLFNAGTTIFDQGTNGTFGGSILGTGTMVKAGAGVLTLGDASELDWSIEAGGLVADASRFIGDVDIGAAGTLRFDHDSGGIAYDGVLSGTGAFLKSGDGGLRLTADSSAFTGATQVLGGLLRVDGILGGGVLVMGGATLDGTGTIGSLTRAQGALLAPGDGSEHFGTFTIDGDFTSLGGTLLFGAVLAGDGSPTSQLHVTGNTSGSAWLQVQHLGGGGAQTRDGILLIQVDGQSAANFTLAGRVVAGPYDYRLFRGTLANPADGNWYLRSQLTFRPEPGAYLANQAASLAMFQHDMRDRLGQMDPAQRLEPDGMRPAWIRASTLQVDATLPDGTSAMEQQASFVQFGADVFGWQRGAIGLMAGAGKANARVTATPTGYIADAGTQGNAIGAYATWFARPDAPMGLYVDGWLQYARHAQRVQGMQLAREDYEAHAATASLEAGYGWRVAQGRAGALFVEPQAQVTWTDYNADRHVEHNGTRVEGADEALATRIGFQLRGEVGPGHARVRPFLALDWRHSGTSAHAMTFDGVEALDGTPEDVYALRAGADVAFSSGWTARANASWDTGAGDFRQLGVQLAASYRW
jgi:fibronectin-binding autotransporter adhesin